MSFAFFFSYVALCGLHVRLNFRDKSVFLPEKKEKVSLRQLGKPFYLTSEKKIMPKVEVFET